MTTSIVYSILCAAASTHRVLFRTIRFTVIVLRLDVHRQKNRNNLAPCNAHGNRKKRERPLFIVGREHPRVLLRVIPRLGKPIWGIPADGAGAPPKLCIPMGLLMEKYGEWMLFHLNLEAGRVSLNLSKLFFSSARPMTFALVDSPRPFRSRGRSEFCLR